MSEPWYRSWSELIAKYFLAKDKTVVPISEIESWGLGKIWGLHEDAMAYFGMRNRYFSLDDVPEEKKVYGYLVEIRGKGVLTQYVWNGYEWVKGGSVHDSYYG